MGGIRKMTTANMTDELKESIELKSDFKHLKENMARYATKEELLSQANLMKADLTTSENKMLEKISETTKNFYNAKVDKWKSYMVTVFTILGISLTGFWNLKSEFRSEKAEMRAEISANTKKLEDLQADMRIVLAEIKKSQPAK